MDTNHEPSKVILWSLMRSLSTAFFKSVSQLDGVNVLFEPFSAAKVITFQQTENPDDAYEIAFKTLCSDQGGKHLFAKIPSITITTKMEMLLRDDIKKFKHVFLIRHPEKTVCSLCRAHYGQNSYVNNLEVTIKGGLQDMHSQATVYKFVKDHFDEDPLVIDADDLLQHPEVVMREFCNRVGFTYDEKMLYWEPGVIPGTENLHWATWFKGAEKSSGFKVNSSSTYDGIPESDKSNIRKIVDQCLPIYDQLYCKRFVPKK